MSILKVSISLISAFGFSAFVFINDASAESATNTPVRIAAKPVQSHDALVVTGFQLIRAGRYKEAVEAFDGAVKLSPKNWQDIYYRGRTYSMMGDSEKGLADLTQAIKLNAENPYAVLERGKLYYTGPKNYKSALADLTNAIKLLPNDANAHEYRGLILNAMGKQQEAISEFTNALALVAVNPPMSREAYLQKHFGEVNVERAEKIKARLYYLRGKCKNDSNQFPHAIGDLDYSIKLDPSTYPVFLERGKALTKVKKKDLAIADLDRATQMARSKDVYKVASALYLELGDKARAEDAAKRAAPPAPPTPPSGTAPSATPTSQEQVKTPATDPTTVPAPAEPAVQPPVATPEK